MRQGQTGAATPGHAQPFGSVPSIESYLTLIYFTSRSLHYLTTYSNSISQNIDRLVQPKAGCIWLHLVAKQSHAAMSAMSCSFICDA